MVYESLRQALRTLLRHRARAFLTMFGVVWGTSAVIFLVSWGDGVRTMLEVGFFKTGKNMGEVWAGRIGEDFTPAADRRYLWFNLEDVEALRRRTRLASRVGAEAWEMLPAAFGQRALTVDVRGMEQHSQEIRGVPLVAGRRISQADVSHRRRVVVLGDRVRRKLLGAQGGIGSWIRLGGKPFRVVGMLRPMGSQLNQDRMQIDDQVWVPISTVHANWPAWWTHEPVVSKIIYRMVDRHQVDAAEREVRAILADRLQVSATDDEAIPIWSSIHMLNQIPVDQTRGMMWTLSIATLVIGGIGVLTMMLDAVHERRHEIGLRLAVGARRRHVLFQFFVETFAITALGGLMGTLLGVGGCWALTQLQVPDMIPVPELSASIVLGALGVMGSVGLLAGVIPAWRAAQIEPAIALRQE